MKSWLNRRLGAHPFRGLRRPSATAWSIYLALGLGTATSLVFSPLLTAGLANHDDRAYRTEMNRPLARDSLRVALSQIHIVPGAASTYQPLADLSVMCDVALAGYAQARPFQFHLTNLTLHCLNAALLWIVLRQLSTGILWPLLASALFAMHPLAVGTIASVSGRPAILGLFFSLLALAFYCHYAGRRHWIWLMPVTLFYAASVLAQPLFVALPVLLLLLDVWPLRRSTWRPIVEKSALFAISLAVCGIQYFIRGHVVSAHSLAVGPSELLARSAGSFVARVVWPWSLSPLYPFGPEILSGGWGALGGAMLSIIILTALAVSLRRSRPLFLAVTGAIVLVAPALVHSPYSDSFLGDTYLYAALIAPCLAIAAWLAATPSFSSARRRVSAIVTLGFVLMLSVSSFAQTFNWHGSRELYAHVVKCYPTWPTGYVKLVEACIAENELDEAVIYARQASRLAPNDPSTQFYLGTALLLQSDSGCAEALDPLRRALASNTNWIECLQNLGVALARSGKLPEAIEQLQKARNLQPDSVGIRIGLGNAYLQAHRPASARAEFQEALRLRSDPDIHLGLAVAWAANEVPELARKHLATAVAGDPRVAMKAATYPELRRLHDEPGFAPLIDLGGESASNRRIGRLNFEMAHTANGS